MIAAQQTMRAPRFAPALVNGGAGFGGSRRAVPRVRATLESTRPPHPSARSQGSKSRVLPLISELCEHNALVLKFETLAGRGAMIGLCVAATFELLVPHKGLFGDWQSAEYSTQVAGLSLFLIALSAALAAMVTRRGSQKFLEPVITSLTSTQRSVGSLSKRNVDKAVDYILDNVFTKQMVERNFPLDD